MPSEWIPLNQIASIPELTPPKDPEFARRLDAVWSGAMPMYYATVPVTLLRPFSSEYDPSKHPIGVQMIERVMRDWSGGQMKYMIGYEQDGAMIISDHYIVLAAIQRGQPEYVPVWVMGKPSLAGLMDVQGPIMQSDIPKLLGFEKDS